MSLFLTPDEVEDLTGYLRFADQRKWLKAHGWLFEEARTGRPIVARSYAEGRLGKQDAIAERQWHPNVACLLKRA